MKPVAYLYQENAEALAPLIATLAVQGGNVHAATPGKELKEALFGLCPLGFLGAWVEEELAAEAARVLALLEPEAREAGRVDAVACGYSGPEGLFLAPRALARLFERRVFPGARVVWIGPKRPELAPGLKGVAEVSLYGGHPREGEEFLDRLPPPVRGPHVFYPHELRPLAQRADLVVFAGGNLPLEVLQPYHTVLALAELPRAAYTLVERVIPPEAFLAERLSLFSEEVLKLPLPPEAFFDL